MDNEKKKSEASANIESKKEQNPVVETGSLNKKKAEKSIAREIFEWAYSIVIAFIVAFLIKTFLFDLVMVDGLSMYPTLNNSERLIVTKLGYEPKQGDIIILDANYSKREVYFDELAKKEGKEELSGTRKFKEKLSLKDDNYKTKYYVKRIIATEGQTVELRDGYVYVDGKKLNEPYYDGLTEPTGYSVSYPFTVSENCVFVMGDNRYNSTDSRSMLLGEVSEEAILGKAQLRVWPLNKFGNVN